MKKVIFIGGILVVMLAVLAIAGYAFAQTVTPPSPGSPRGCGGSGRCAGMGNWRGNQGGNGAMHEYMEDAIAEALNIDHEELEELLEQGKSLWQIAEEKGFTQEQFSELMDNARSKALEKMVDDGVITEEQADWMKNRMDFMWGRMWQNGRNPGGCPMGRDSDQQSRGPGFRWNNPPSQITPSPSF